jgi:hypothetical protein
MELSIFSFLENSFFCTKRVSYSSTWGFIPSILAISKEANSFKSVIFFSSSSIFFNAFKLSPKF